MNTARLRKLADYLENLDPSGPVKFNMGAWFRTAVNFVKRIVVNPKTSEVTVASVADDRCGTSACALGHAALIPEFRKLGLQLELRSDGEGSVRYKSLRGAAAGRAFFGLNDRTAEILFGAAPSTPLRKAEQIRRLIALGQTGFRA